MMTRHGHRAEVVKRHHGRGGERDGDRAVWSPQDVDVANARQEELLPEDADRRGIDAKAAPFDSLAVVISAWLAISGGGVMSSRRAISAVCTPMPVRGGTRGRPSMTTRR